MKQTIFYIHSEDSVDTIAYDRVHKKEERMIELLDSQEIPLLAKNLDFVEEDDNDIKLIIRGYYERKSKYI